MPTFRAGNHFLSFSLSLPEINSTDNAGADDDQALLERLAKREERRQKRMKEALERQKELEPTVGTPNGTDGTQDEQSSFTNGNTQQDAEDADGKKKSVQEEVAKTDTNSWSRQGDEKKEDGKVGFCISVCLWGIEHFL